MRTKLLTMVVVGGLASSWSGKAQLRAGAGPQTAAAEGASTPARDLVTRYCVSCHNERVARNGVNGNVQLDKVDALHVANTPEVWERVIRQLRQRAMPPPGARRPEPAVYDAVATYLGTELDRAAAAKPNPGYVGVFHRLTRTEYQNAIRDLLALEALPKELDIASLLPADNTGTGFDNLADLLFVSPAALEAYLSAARKISRLAVGDPAILEIVDRYLLSSELSQDERIEGAPLGTRGGLVTRTDFPVDGHYLLNLEWAGNARERHELEISVDGRRERVFTLLDKRPDNSDPDYRPPPKKIDVNLALSAGPHSIVVAFVQHTAAVSEALVRPRMRTRGSQPHLVEVTIRGPESVTGAGDSPSRRRLFVCRPNRPAEEAACARQILSTLTRRAYRRASIDEDVTALMPFYEAGKSQGGFDRGIQSALERVLVSPQFLFRIEPDPTPGAVVRVSDVELASRLSFFLWSSIPDDELLNVAIRGKLQDPAVVAQQVRRMLADARSEALVTNFSAQWLFLRDIESKRPDRAVFPDFDDSLMSALRREAELFLFSMFREDHKAVDLLDADYTFVNERLAKHYGIPHVYGPEFRRVTVTDDYRRGLLGKGGILLLTSYSTRTSPVLRGKYVLTNLLGAPPPPPPPNVPSLKTESSKDGKPLTMREAMVQHRQNPVCATCHSRMDPIGFALDNFDAIGRWRMVGESNTPIDASGVTPDGTKFDGVVGLRDVLLSNPEPFIHTLTENLLTYALGRSLAPYDQPAVRKIMRDADRDGYRLSSLILQVVQSTPFRMKTSAPMRPPQTTQVSKQ